MVNAVTGSKRGPVHGRPLHKLLSSKSGGCLGSNVPCLPITALIREAAPKGLRRLTAFRIFGFLETFLNELTAHTHTHTHTYTPHTTTNTQTPPLALQPSMVATTKTGRSVEKEESF